MNNRDRIIVALDLDQPDDAIHLARILSPVFPFFKVGMKLFTRAGPEFVKEILKHGRVFLDLKFYDIPTIVSEAVSQAAALGVSLLTVHASGGSTMMNLCMEKLRPYNGACRLLGVTVLTSFDSLAEIGVDRGITEQVQLLASLAHSSGTDGIVCSPQELTGLRSKFVSPFLLVTPGIRGTGDAKGDQKRTAGAPDALKAGADYVVIGRPVIAAADPVEAAERIAMEIG